MKTQRLTAKEADDLWLVVRRDATNVPLHWGECYRQFNAASGYGKGRNRVSAIYVHRSLLEAGS